MKNKLTLIFLFSLPLIVLSQNSEQYTWRYYRPGNTGIQGDDATALWVDGNGDPYIAANTGNWGEGGFAKFDQAENKWINYSNVDDSILGSFDNGDVQILDIIKDYDNNLWMGNFTGAIKFTPADGSTSLLNYNSGNSELLGFTYDVDLAPDSTIWFTSGGLVRFNPKNNQWTSWEGSNTRIAVQPKPDGSYLVWSADTYFGYVFTYNSATNLLTYYTPEALGEIAGLPGKDCVDDAGNFWALRMSVDGNWETLEYQQPDGTWVYPTPPYENVSFYIDAFKAYGQGKALLVTTTGETWMFDGAVWNNYGTWRPGDFSQSVDTDQEGNVWVCGIGGAAKRDVTTGNWQRYRITNTSQIDYFVEDLSVDNDGNVWFTGNAGTGVGGFQKFDGTKWTGFNEYTYGLGYPFPYDADNTQAIYSRPSNGEIIFNPTFHGIHAWNGSDYSPLEDVMSVSEGFAEDSQGRLWSLGEYYNIRYYNGNVNDWTTLPIVGWGSHIIKDPANEGSIWATTDYEIQRTDGINTFSRGIEDFPGSAAWFTGFAADANGIVWVGTWSQNTSTGSTLIRLDANTGLYDTWSYDEGWPFPGEHVRPLTITPDGKLWMQYDSEYPSTVAGLLWYDGENIETFPSAPGGIPQWGGLPNSNIKDLEVKEIASGYELWMSCMGRGIAVLKVISDVYALFTANPVTTCEGEQVTFTDESFSTDNTVISWNWTFEGGNPATSSLQNPVVTYNAVGIFDVQLIVTDGVHIDTLLKQNYISIEAIPFQPEIPVGSSDVCGAYDTELTTDPVEYTDVYEWIVTPSNAGTIVGNGNIVDFHASPSWTGPCVVNVRATGLCGTSDWSDDFSLTIWLTPDFFNLTGIGVYCSGGPGAELVLDGSEIGVDYELYKNNNPTGIIISGTGSPLSFSFITETGTYKVGAFTDQCFEFMNYEVYVNEITLPAQADMPIGPEVVCNMDTSFFQTTEIQYADNYVWSLEPVEAGTITPMQQEISIIWNSSFTGLAELSVYGENICGSGPVSAPLSITVNNSPNPIINGLQEVCKNDEETYQTQNNPESSYSWQVTGGEIISGAGTSEVIIKWALPGEGLMSVTELNDVGCQVTSYLPVQIDDCTFIGESQTTVKAYPNPAGNVLNISFANVNLSNIDIFISDITGKTLFSSVQYTNNAIQLDVSGLKGGIYLISLYDDQKILLHHKFIKK